MPPIRNDEQVNDDMANAVRFAMDAMHFIAMTDGVVGTMGGAAIAIGVAGAGAGAPKSQDKVDNVSALPPPRSAATPNW
jgi:thymidine phosphorylase